MTGEEAQRFEELEKRLGHIERVLEQFLDGTFNAATLAEVNVEAGMAADQLHNQ